MNYWAAPFSSSSASPVIRSDDENDDIEEFSSDENNEDLNRRRRLLTAMSLNYGGSPFDPHYHRQAVAYQQAAQVAAAQVQQQQQSNSASQQVQQRTSAQSNVGGYEYATVTNPYDPASLLSFDPIVGGGAAADGVVTGRSHASYRLTQPSTAAGTAPSPAAALNAASVFDAAAGGGYGMEPDPLVASNLVSAAAARHRANSSSTANSDDRAACAAAYSTYTMRAQPALEAAAAPGLSWQDVYLSDPKSAAALVAASSYASRTPNTQSSSSSDRPAAQPPLSLSSPPTATASAPFTSSSQAALTSSAAVRANSVHNDHTDDPSISSITLEVPGVSLEPLSGSQVIELVRTQTDDVVTRYLPCVDFLVNCQQELRAGLAVAIKKRLVGRHFSPTMTPNQFYHRYIEPLPTRFYHKNKHLMETTILDTATKQIVTLCGEAKTCHISGCESMKNSFLGGMRENRSWGLRKWLSENGGALKICNDLELVLQSIKNLAKDLDSTKKLTEFIRPMAKQAFDRLKNDVPSAYQEVSSAHPFLPFFHRLESALNGLANYDPDDDDVICIDDSDDEDEIQEVKKPSPPSPPPKRTKKEVESKKRSYGDTFGGGGNSGFEKNERFKTDTTTYTRRLSTGEDDDSDIEILEIRPAPGEEDVNDEDEHDVNNIREAAQAGSAAASRPRTSLSPNPLAAAGAEGQLSPTPPPLAAGKKDWRCPLCTYPNKETDTRCVFCKGGDDDGTDLSGVTFDEAAAAIALTDGWGGGGANSGAGSSNGGGGGPSSSSNVSTISRPASSESDDNATSPQSTPTDKTSPDKLIEELEDLASYFDKNQGHLRIPASIAFQSDYWNKPHHYAYILRLLQSILKNPASQRFIDPVDETELFMMGGAQYRSIIKNPLCFKDILEALDLPRLENISTPSTEGQLLNCPALRSWNMWNGRHLLEAMDLVFLNALAYHGKGKTSLRTEIQAIRRVLWDGINENLAANLVKEHKKHVIPTKRGETSGFVVLKKNGPYR